MATRLYLVPMDGTGDPSQNDPFRPRYFTNSLGASTISSGRSAFQLYGLEAQYLVAADVTPQEHTTISAQPGVLALPANLDAAVGANLAAVQTALESRGFPCEWADAATTYRQLIRHVNRCMQLGDAMMTRQGSGVRLLPPGISLNSRVSDLSPAQRQRMADVIADLGGTASEVRGTMTIRQAIKTLADQLPIYPKLLDIDL